MDIVSSKVTIVIPVYNYEKYVAQAIKSILSQTLQDWKLLIVDDCSTDNTAEVVKQYLGDHRIQYLSLEENKGTGFVLNYALERIDTPYFVVLDADDWFEDSALEILLGVIDKQPKTTSTIYSNLKRWDTKNDITTYRDIFKHRAFSSAEKYEFMLYEPMIYPRFYRTESVRSVNGFELDDPNEGRYGEDRYLLYKLIGVSDFYHVEDVLYNRRHHEMNAIRRENRTNFAQSKKYYTQKVLNQWGNEYLPVFEIKEDGWLRVVLKKKNPEECIL